MEQTAEQIAARRIERATQIEKISRMNDRANELIADEQAKVNGIRERAQASFDLFEELWQEFEKEDPAGFALYMAGEIVPVLDKGA